MTRFSRIALVQARNLNFRAHFTKFLMSPRTRGIANPQAWRILTMMNRRLAADNVPLAYEHFYILRRSILNRDPICTILKNERQAVLKSTGQGAAYKAGYAFHKVISLVTPNCIEEKELSCGDDES